jgi:hypothetical protein
MNKNYGLTGLLHVVLLLAIFLTGSCNAIEYVVSAPNQSSTADSLSVADIAPPAVVRMATPLASSVYCFSCLPKPIVKFLPPKENVTANGVEYIRYNFEVVNRDDYPASLFKVASPALQPCGLNYNSSRTWLHIYNQNGTRVYGFCALTSPSDMKKLWFSVAKSSMQPTGFYIELYDRACNFKPKSSIVLIT